MSELTDFINNLPEGERKSLEHKVSLSIATIQAKEATNKASMYAISAEVSPASLGWEQLSPTIWRCKSDGRVVEFGTNQRQVFLKLVEIKDAAS